MRFPEYKYVGWKNQVRGATNIALFTEVPHPIPETELYQSVYRFPEEILKLPSLGDIPPDVKFFADYIIFDFDSKKLEEAFEDAKQLCARLDSVKCPYQIWFSGNKGFHVWIPSEVINLEPTNETWRIQGFCSALASGLKTWDPSIYNKSRVIRATNSYNLGGKRYKIEVSVDETIESIVQRAKSPQRVTVFLENFDPIPELVAIWDSLIKKPDPVYNRVNIEQDPKVGGSIFVKAEEGRRNETAYTVARRLARKGIPLSDARGIMEEVWNRRMCDPPLDGGELERVLANAYSKGTNYSAAEDPQAAITDIKQGLGDVSQFFKTQKQGFLTGYEFIDKYTMGFQPEELIFIPGRSGTFKSTILTHFLQRGSKIAKRPALYFSMEMGKETLVPRLVQQSYGVTKKEVIEGMRRGDVPMRDVEEDFEYLKFCYLSNLNTDGVMGIIDAHIEKYGPLSAIGFDYLGLFRGVNNNTERTAKQAQELKTIVAKSAHCPVFCLTQAKQIYEGREADIELDRTCAKDSDSVLDLGDYIMGHWNHWFVNPQTQKEEKYLFGRFLKSRGMDEETYGVNPYYAVSIQPSFLRIDDFIHFPNPPAFKQKGGSSDGA